MESKPATFRELRKHLLESHGCRRETLSIFPGQDNAEGPTHSRIVNTQNGSWVNDIEYGDDEPVTGSMCHWISRRLGIPAHELDLVNCDGEHVSVEPPPVNPDPKIVSIRSGKGNK